MHRRWTVGPSGHKPAGDDHASSMSHLLNGAGTRPVIDPNRMKMGCEEHRARRHHTTGHICTDGEGTREKYEGMLTVTDATQE